MFKGDLGRSGSHGASGVQELSGVAWQREFDKPVSGAAVVDGQVLVAAEFSGRVHALDAQTGEALWTRDVGAVVESPVAIADGTVYVGAAGELVCALDLADGAELWRVQHREHHLERDHPSTTVHPTVAGDLLVCRSGWTLSALDRKTGERSWWTTPYSEGPLPSSPAVVDGLVIHSQGGYSGGNALTASVEATGLATGEQEVWSYYSDDSDERLINPDHPTIADGLVFVFEGDQWWDEESADDIRRNLIALDARTGALVWSRDLPAGQCPGHAAAVEQGTVWFTTSGVDDEEAVIWVAQAANTGTLWAVPTTGGEPRAVYQFGSAPAGAPLLAGGLVHVPTVDGTVHAVDAATGTARWTYQGDPYDKADMLNLPSLVELAVADGRVYVTSKNRIVALG